MKEIIVNGQKVTKEKFQEMKDDPNLQIRKVEGRENEYKTYERIMG